MAKFKGINTLTLSFAETKRAVDLYLKEILQYEYWKTLEVTDVIEDKETYNFIVTFRSK